MLSNVWYAHAIYHTSKYFWTFLNILCEKQLTSYFLYHMYQSMIKKCSWISKTIVDLKKTQKTFLWISSVYLNFRNWNFSRRGKPWLRKYLLHCHFQIFIQGRVMLKKISVWFLAICVNYSCKIEKFEVEVVGIGVLGTRFGF